MKEKVSAPAFKEDFNNTISTLPDTWLFNIKSKTINSLREIISEPARQVRNALEDKRYNKYEIGIDIKGLDQDILSSLIQKNQSRSIFHEQYTDGRV